MEVKTWQDTVIKFKCHCETYCQECICPCDDCTRVKNINQSNLEQAEISFKAAIREVLNTYKQENPGMYKKYEEYWQMKFKEWGIEK